MPRQGDELLQQARAETERRRHQMHGQ
jgi:hypothetical protein